MDGYRSRVAEALGTILHKSVSRRSQIVLIENYLANSSPWQFFVKAYDCNLPLLILIPLSQHHMEILSYSCHDLRLLLQDLQSLLIDSPKTLKKSAAYNCPLCQTRATMGCSHKEDASCIFQDALGILVGTAP